MRSCSGGGTLVSLCKGATFSRSRCVFHVFTTTSIKMEVKHTVFPHFQRSHSCSNKIYFKIHGVYHSFLWRSITLWTCDDHHQFTALVPWVRSFLCYTTTNNLLARLNNHSAYRRNRRNQGKGTKLFANYSAWSNNCITAVHYYKY